MKSVNGDDMRRMEAMARDIGDKLGNACKLIGPDKGFCLMLFSFEGPEFTYISNAQRPDMLKMLDEFISRNRRGEADQMWSERS